MNLTNLKPLNSADHYYYKVQVYVPQNNVESLKQNLSEHGLAEEGNYEYCFLNQLVLVILNQLMVLILIKVNYIQLSKLQKLSWNL